jgi:hypothetical protein
MNVHIYISDYICIHIYVYDINIYTYIYIYILTVYHIYSPEIPIVVPPGSPSPLLRVPRPSAASGSGASGASGAPRWQVGERLGGWRDMETLMDKIWIDMV